LSTFWLSLLTKPRHAHRIVPRCIVSCCSCFLVDFLSLLSPPKKAPSHKSDTRASPFRFVHHPSTNVLFLRRDAFFSWSLDLCFSLSLSLFCAALYSTASCASPSSHSATSLESSIPRCCCRHPSTTHTSSLSWIFDTKRDSTSPSSSNNRTLPLLALHTTGLSLS
jgi:hypothetical protein